MTRQELLAAWTSRLDGGTLTASESSTLCAALAHDAALREVLLADLALDGLLRNRLDDAEAGRAFTAGVATILRAQAEPPEFAARVRQRIVHSQRLRLRRSSRRAGGWVAALAAGLLLLLGGAWLIRPNAVDADLPSIVTADVRPGDALAAGATIAASGDTILAWRDGTRATLQAGSRLTVLPAAGKSLRLDRGRIAVQAAPQPDGRPLTIRSPEGLATVVGTAFTLDTDLGITRLQVAHGIVRLGAAGSEALVGAGGRAIADAAGARATPLPLWEWSAGDARSPVPLLGERGAAPDGRPCLVALRAGNPVVAAHFKSTPAGLFAYDPDAVVVCDLWLGAAVRWAGFYLQDDGSGRPAGAAGGDAHMGQWHVALAVRDGWIRVRFPLRDLVEGGQRPLLQRGDRVHHLIIQAQPADRATLYLDRLEVLPGTR